MRGRESGSLARELVEQPRTDVRVPEAALMLALGVTLPVASVWADAEGPRLLAIEPDRVWAHQPTTLTLQGSGFQPEATVLIETGRAGKFLRYRPKALENDRCVVSLSSGFPSQPSEVAVFVENRDGSRSEQLSLIVEPVSVEVDGSKTATPEADQQLEPDNDSGSEPLESQLAPDHVPPTIREVRPSTIPAGRPLILEIFGSGFEEESEVLVTANLHAGTSRLPEYALRAFSSYFIDAGLIEVEFDLGFYPIPGVRDIVVANPSGTRSQPATLEILQEPTDQED